MRRATATLAVCLCLALAGLAVGGFATADLTDGGSQSGLTAAWVSETPRDNELNHHAVGVGPAVSSDGFEDASTGDGSVGRDSRADPVVVAPVTSLPRSNETRTRTDCALVRLAAADGSAVWRQGVAPEHCFSHAFTAPAVADVDGDGTVEVVAGTAAERLVVRDGRSGRLVATASLSAYGYGRPAVANLSAGPGQSVVASP